MDRGKIFEIHCQHISDTEDARQGENKTHERKYNRLDNTSFTHQRYVDKLTFQKSKQNKTIAGG